mgnify:CR=1 FL=1
MAKKPAGKPAQSSGLSPLAIGGIVVVIAAVAALLFWPKGATEPTANSASTSGPAVSADVTARAATKAAFGPHKQDAYPPIPFQAYAPPRSREVVTEAYKFTAEHPEISTYVPCFCGCEQAGHEGNTDCFVRKRDANGDVVEWEPHGVDCAVCIDVATVSRQMFNSGASVSEIRAAIDKQFGGLYPSKMPTPKPPSRQAAAETGEHAHTHAVH